MAGIARNYGSYSLHRIVEARPGGEQFLEVAGRRAMLPPEGEVHSDMATLPPTDFAEVTDGHRGLDTQEVPVVTVNVDGMGHYAPSATDRIAGILEEILKVSPHVVLMQEVTAVMYAEIKETLCGWQVYERLGCRQPFQSQRPHPSSWGDLSPPNHR